MAQGEWKETTELIRAALVILKEQQPMTIRQLFYAFVVRELLQNAQSDYKRVSRMMTKARDDGRCPWEWIVDRSREVYAPTVWRDPAGYAHSVRNSYRKDYWEMQPEHCEVWIEKDAAIGSISDLCDELGVTVRPFKGFNSTTKVHEAAEWLSGITKPITIFYCGDHDASGRCIDTEGPGRVMHYGSGQFRLKRLAIHKADIRRFRLPPQRVKDTDSRALAFRQKYGDETVELDALPPVELRRRIREAIEGKMDREKWQRAVEIEKVELRSIVETVNQWPGMKASAPVVQYDARKDPNVRSELTREGKRKVIEQAAKGISQRQIAANFKVAESTIVRILADEAKREAKRHAANEAERNAMSKSDANKLLSQLTALDNSGPFSDRIRDMWRVVNPNTGRLFGEELLARCEAHVAANRPKAKTIALYLSSLRAFIEEAKRKR